VRWEAWSFEKTSGWTKTELSATAHPWDQEEDEPFLIGATFKSLQHLLSEDSEKSRMVALKLGVITSCDDAELKIQNFVNSKVHLRLRYSCLTCLASDQIVFTPPSQSDQLEIKEVESLMSLFEIANLEEATR
jgi:hypothetical protein